MSDLTTLKLTLIDYYQNLTSRIDLKTQLLLIDSLTPEERNKLLHTSESFVTKCEQTLRESIQEINEAEEEHQNDSTSMGNFDEKNLSYCLLIEDSVYPMKNPIGILIAADWRLNEMEIRFINRIFKVHDKSTLDVLHGADPKVITLSEPAYQLTENLVLLKHAYERGRPNMADILTLCKQTLQSDTNKSVMLKLSGFEFTSIENTAFQSYANMTELSMANNRIKVLPSRLFNGTLPNLKRLDLYRCSIKIIEPDAFQGLDQLQELNLAHNPQIDLNSCRQFNGLTNLQVLNLSDNDLKSDITELEIFTNLGNLFRLEMTMSSMRRHITKRMFTGLVKLEELNIAHCTITNIERGSFMSLANLKCLKLDFNYLQIIDSTTFEGLINLEQLYLKDCSISRIEVDSFCHLNKLRKLYFDSNAIQCLDASVFNGLEKLEELTLDYRLDILMNVFQDLTNLKSLSFIVQQDTVFPRNPIDIKKLFNLSARLTIYDSEKRIMFSN